jgi:hypothetical protein
MNFSTAAGPVLRRWLPVLAIAVLLTVAWLKPLDRSAETQLKDGLGRALATYAVARTFNGVVSILQETGVSIQPAGIGMSFAPGQILDPVNDLVEQFASIMLAVCVSIGIQLALLKLGGSLLVSIALTGGLLWWAMCLFRGRPLTPWESRLIVAVVVVRFAVPVVAASSEWAYQQALAQQYEQTQNRLTATVDEVKKTAPVQDLKSDQAQKDETLLERVKKLPDTEWAKKLREWLGVDAAVAQAKAKYEQIRIQLDNAVADMVHMIALFALQTVLIPLLFLWLLGQLASRLVDARTRST